MSASPPPVPPPSWPDPRPRSPTPREWATAVGLFLATCVSSWLVYGWFWGGGSVLDDPQMARDGALYAGGLMAILLAHESGHYVVARRHGMDQSLPYFIPFPLAFGTLGAIIRLRVLPRSRTALLEMGAAGPLAGFGVAVLVMALGLPHTQDVLSPTVVTAWPPPVVAPPEGLLVDVLVAVDGALSAGVEGLRGLSAQPGFGWLGGVLDRSFPVGGPGSQVVMILANPKLMDVLGHLILGHAPGRYASIHPLTLAGWAGCFLTAMNLLPIGQLDGGHIFNALAPRWARRVSRLGLVVAGLAGLLWLGWAIWGLLLWKMGAWRSLPVPGEEAPSPRARLVAASAGLCFILCFMPEPFEQDVLELADLDLRTPEGERIPPDVVQAWVEAQSREDSPAPSGSVGAGPSPH